MTNVQQVSSKVVLLCTICPVCLKNILSGHFEQLRRRCCLKEPNIANEGQSCFVYTEDIKSKIATQAQIIVRTAIWPDVTAFPLEDDKQIDLEFFLLLKKTQQNKTKRGVCHS